MTDDSSDNIFDVDRVRDLVELMIEYGLTEIDLRQHGNTVRLQRGTPPSVAAAQAMVPVAAMPQAPAAGANPANDDDSDLLIIKSPMVGTFYGRPKPDAEPFVKVGQAISPDTTVCIIEAMKVFNDIAAEVSGTVVAVLVEDEEAVEFGKPIMKVRPN